MEINYVEDYHDGEGEYGPPVKQWGLSPATMADLQEIADTPDYWGIGPEGGLWVRPGSREEERALG